MLAAALSGCRAATTPILPVALLADSVPPPLLGELEEQLTDQARLRVFSIDTLNQIYDLLRRGGVPNVSFLRRLVQQRSPTPPQLATLGDAWLTSAIRNDLIVPVAVESLAGWERLPPPWQQLVRRNAAGLMAEAGSLWGAPYRWGMLAIAYRLEQFPDTPPTDWEVLWRDDLTRKIALPDRARAVIGLTLKSLGYSANTTDPTQLAAVAPKLAALQQQVRLYSSDAYLQPLTLGDVSVAVGWTTDILPILQRNPRLGAVIPAAGTLLTADLWVQPNAAAATLTDGIWQNWVEFFWQPDIAQRLSLLGAGASPVVVTERATQPDSLRTNELLLPAADRLNQSEFLLPLSPASAATYSALWQQMRQGRLSSQGETFPRPS